MSIELAQRAAAGAIDSTVLKWLTTAMKKHLAGADLESALGLSRSTRVRARNQALRDAGHLLDEQCDWRRAIALESAIKRYETRIVPILTRNPDYPLAPLDEAIRRAFMAGVRVPRTARNLLDIVR